MFAIMIVWPNSKLTFCFDNGGPASRWVTASRLWLRIELSVIHQSASAFGIRNRLSLWVRSDSAKSIAAQLRHEQIPNLGVFSGVTQTLPYGRPPEGGVFLQKDREPAVKNAWPRCRSF